MFERNGQLSLDSEIKQVERAYPVGGIQVNHAEAPYIGNKYLYWNNHPIYVESDDKFLYLVMEREKNNVRLLEQGCDLTNSMDPQRMKRQTEILGACDLDIKCDLM